MKKTPLLVAILIVLILGLIGELLLYLNINNYIKTIRIISGIGHIIALLVLLKYGSFVRTKTFIPITIFFIFITAVGLLFKILHWEGADQLLILGLTGIPLVYSVHFLNKKNKMLIDYLKALWVILFFIAELFTILHWDYRDLFMLIQGITFLILFAVFTSQSVKIERVNNPN